MAMFYSLTVNLIELNGRMRPGEYPELNCVSDLWNRQENRSIDNVKAIK
jgi:hypothetical protein